jgi:mannan endo-1,4-beta-mannosidase
MNAKSLLLGVLLVLSLLVVPLLADSETGSAASPSAGQDIVPAAKPPTATAGPTEAKPTKEPRSTKTPLPTATATSTSTETLLPTDTPPPTDIPTETPTITPSPSPTSTDTPTTIGPIYWGVNLSGVPWDLNVLSTWEQNVAGKPVSIIHWGHFWDGGGDKYQAWSDGTINNARLHGSIPMISWTPEGGKATRWRLSTIIDGTHDAYIRQFATDAKKWGYPFFLRIMHEMNGNWGYPWQEDSNGNSRGEFVLAWRHIIDIFREVGVSNASYVWCPNVEYPDSPWPSFESLYPGDDYVDWTCLDGYNWGTNRSSGWQTFDEIYSYSYGQLLNLAPSKPVMIGEFGSVEEGGSKAGWFTDVLTTQVPDKYGRVRALVYFNFAFDGVDWRIETSQSSIDAWHAGIGSGYYAPNNYGSATGSVAVP